MKLSKIYSNFNDIFKPILFNEGFNVIIGKVKKPKDKEKDSHNLGKTLLIYLIDFLLLRKLTAEFFLKKHFDLFKDFVFFLEIEVDSEKFFTIRRSVDKSSKIFLKLHSERNKDFTELDESDWDYNPSPFIKAKEKINELLDLSIIFPPFNYRNGVSYFLRTQKDFTDVFQLDKFKGKHKTWKPYLAKIFGFDYKLVKLKYQLDELIDRKKEEIKYFKIESSLQDQTEEYDKIKGLIEIIKNELKILTNKIDRFNFYTTELNLNRELIEEVEANIAYYNKLLYTCNYEIKKINESLGNKIEFSIEKTKRLFEEIGIFFPEQLKKSYDDVEQFNKQLYSEREKHLKETLIILKKERTEIETILEEKNNKRMEMLSVLENKDTFAKFKEYQYDVIKKEKNLTELENKLSNLDEIGKKEN